LNNSIINTKTKKSSSSSSSTTTKKYVSSSVSSSTTTTATSVSTTGGGGGGTGGGGGGIDSHPYARGSVIEILRFGNNDNIRNKKAKNENKNENDNQKKHDNYYDDDNDDSDDDYDDDDDDYNYDFGEISNYSFGEIRNNYGKIINDAMMEIDNDINGDNDNSNSNGNNDDNSKESIIPQISKRNNIDKYNNREKDIKNQSTTAPNNNNNKQNNNSKKKNDKNTKKKKSTTFQQDQQKQQNNNIYLVDIIDRSPSLTPHHKLQSHRYKYYIHYRNLNRRMDEWILSNSKRIISPPSIGNAKAREIRRAQRKKEEARERQALLLSLAREEEGGDCLGVAVAHGNDGIIVGSGGANLLGGSGSTNGPRLIEGGGMVLPGVGVAGGEVIVGKKRRRSTVQPLLMEHSGSSNNNNQQQSSSSQQSGSNQGNHQNQRQSSSLVSSSSNQNLSLGNNDGASNSTGFSRSRSRRSGSSGTVGEWGSSTSLDRIAVATDESGGGGGRAPPTRRTTRRKSIRIFTGGDGTDHGGIGGGTGMAGNISTSNLIKNNSSSSLVTCSQDNKSSGVSTTINSSSSLPTTRANTTVATTATTATNILLPTGSNVANRIVTVAAREMDEHEGLDEASLREHEEVTKVKNVATIQLGRYKMDTWYFSPIPKEMLNRPQSVIDILYVCEFTLNFFTRSQELLRFQSKGLPGGRRYPPGNEIYRNGNLSMFEIDGFEERLYCQNLCYIAKMFLDHKTLYFDVDPFLFYVLCEVDTRGFHPVAYYSKEKYSDVGYNLACILTFPCHQRKGYGRFLIAFSYELTKKEEKVGSPEKPMSDLGQQAYKPYWTSTIIDFLLHQSNEGSMSIMEISKRTSIMAEDIIYTLNLLGLLKYINGVYFLSAERKVLEGLAVKHPVKEPRVDASRLHWTPYITDVKRDKFSIYSKKPCIEEEDSGRRGAGGF